MQNLPQMQPIPKTELQNGLPYPTVMIPGIGPCVMIPQDEKVTQNGTFFIIHPYAFFRIIDLKFQAEMQKKGCKKAWGCIHIYCSKTL